MKYYQSVIFIFIIVNFSLAQSNETAHTNVKNNIAIDGYDPVSFFDQKPVEGSKNIKSSYEGITYLFNNDINKGKFEENPERFIPKYGGWCAYAMGATGDKVKIDPETYKILDGELYLFYNFWGNNTLKDWNKDEKNLKSKADTYWSEIIK